MNSKKIADKMAQVFFQNSAIESYGHRFQQTKQQLEATDIVVNEDDNNYVSSFFMFKGLS
jgi:hypothetical protein